MTDTALDYRGHTVEEEPQDSLVPIRPNATVEVGLGDIYSVLADIHAIESRKLQIMEGVAGLVNQAGEQLPEILKEVQESPLFGMLSGGGGIGGILGGLFRK